MRNYTSMVFSMKVLFGTLHPHLVRQLLPFLSSRDSHGLLPKEITSHLSESISVCAARSAGVLNPTGKAIIFQNLHAADSKPPTSHHSGHQPPLKQKVHD